MMTNIDRVRWLTSVVAVAVAVVLAAAAPAGAAVAPAGQVRYVGTPDAVAGGHIVVLEPHVAAAGAGSSKLFEDALALSDAPTIGGVYCESAASRVFCDLTFTGGVGPFQTRWTYNGNPVPAWDNRFTINSVCYVGTRVTIGVRVIGSNGLEDGETGGAFCIRGIP